MVPVKELLNAFEMHYSDDSRRMKYTDHNRNEIVRKYMWMTPAYMLAVYEEVVGTHSMSFRCLPDTAIIEKALKGMDRPEVYEKPKAQIEYVDIDNDKNGREVWMDLLARMGSELGRRLETDGEPNHAERERVAVRIAKGNASDYEKHWLKCMRDNNGIWQKMEEQ